MQCEADFQTKFGRWSKASNLTTQAAELKFCKKKSLPYSQIAPHQIRALHLAKHGTLYYKISDTGYDSKPFDCFILSGVPAFLYVMFHVGRGTSHFYGIDIDVLMNEINSSDRKSLTEERAREIGDKYDLKNKLV